MSSSDRPWFAGAWRRQSIAVPGSAPAEPCEAWWIQTENWFVDVRRALPGHEDNDLPYSQTRAFAGRFEVADGEVRWHLLLDTAGLAPRTDRAAESGLFISPADPLLMVEDAPGRFTELWIQCAPDATTTSHVDDSAISVDVGGYRAMVSLTDAGVAGRVWAPTGQLLVEVDTSHA